MSFVVRFSLFALGTLMAAIWAPEKLRQPGWANTAAMLAWFLAGGLIFTL